MKCSQVLLAVCLVGSAAVQANPFLNIAKKAAGALAHHKSKPHVPANSAPKVAHSAKVAKFKGAAKNAGTAARKAGNSAIKAAGGREQAAQSAGTLYSMYQQHKQAKAAAGADAGVESRRLSDEEVIHLVSRLLRNEDGLYTRGYYDFELDQLD